MDFEHFVATAAQLIEVLGVVVMVCGVVVSAVLALGRRPRAGPSAQLGSRYRVYRRYLGSAILLGLEFLVAADIIRTVSTVPSLNQVIVLGIIVLIRTFLSFTLEVELEGVWPWQKPPRPAA